MIYIIVFLILIAWLYILSIRPNKKRNLDEFLNHLYAHRGVHDNKANNPENSLLAFEMAVEKGYGIELDLQVTRDNIPLVFHDKTLSRVCKIEKPIDEFTLKELADLRLFTSDQSIPTLEEVLKLVDGEVPLIVEIKNESTDISELIYIAEILDKYRGIYCIESFNPLVLRWYKKNRPQLIRGQLSTYYKKKNSPLPIIVRDFILENLMANFISKPDFIAFNYKHKNMFSFKLCKKLYSPLTAAYTIKNQKQFNKNKNDFDLFIFDSFIPK